MLATGLFALFSTALAATEFKYLSVTDHNFTPVPNKCPDIKAGSLETWRKLERFKSGNIVRGHSLIYTFEYPAEADGKTCFFQFVSGNGQKGGGPLTTATTSQAPVNIFKLRDPFPAVCDATTSNGGTRGELVGKLGVVPTKAVNQTGPDTFPCDYLRPQSDQPPRVSFEFILSSYFNEYYLTFGQGVHPTIKVSYGLLLQYS